MSKALGKSKKAAVKGNETLSQEHKKDIAAAFALFDQDGGGKINRQALRVCLEALGQSPTQQELNQTVTEHGDAEGLLDFNAFKGILDENIKKADSVEQITQSFKFFANPSTNCIEVDDLKAVAEELGENTISLEEIEQMITIACSTGDGKVTQEDFCKLVHQKDAKQ